MILATFIAFPGHAGRFWPLRNGVRPRRRRWRSLARIGARRPGNDSRRDLLDRRDRLGDREAALVQRPAGDDPAECGDRRQGAHVVERRHSPAGDHGRRRRRHGGGDPVDVGPGELAVALDVGDRRTPRRRRIAPARSASESLEDDVQPSTATTPRRWSRATATGMRSATASTSVGSATAAEPMTTRATPASARAEASSRVRTPPPAWTVRPSSDRGGDGSDGRSVGRNAAAARRRGRRRGSTPRRRRERDGDVDGIVPVRRFARVVALAQAHDATVSEVDRRVQLRDVHCVPGHAGRC